jgi:DnaJ-class molecular chaperone
MWNESEEYKIQQLMKLFDIEQHPFSVSLLKKRYRVKAAKFHPDKHETQPEPVKKQMEEKFKEVNEAFNLLLKAAQKEVKAVTSIEFKRVYEGLRKVKEEQSYRVYEICRVCKGKGKEVVSVEKTRFTRCDGCKGKGWFTLKCNRCRNGIFRKKNGNNVKCKMCKGTGIFRQSVFCKSCHGFGYYFGRTKAGVEHVTCSKCKGKGEMDVTPFNPVIMPFTI